MLDDPAGVANALEGTTLAGRPVQRAALDDDTGDALVVRCDDLDVLASWSAARDVLDQTGRWPVAVCDWGGRQGFADLSALFGAHDPSDDDPSAHALLARAEAVDPDAALAALEARDDARRWRDPDDQRRWIRYQLDATVRSHGSSPTPDDVAAALVDPGDLTLDRWLFEWEQGNEPNEAADLTDGRRGGTWGASRTGLPGR